MSCAQLTSSLHYCYHFVNAILSTLYTHCTLSIHVDYSTLILRKHSEFLFCYSENTQSFYIVTTTKNSLSFYIVTQNTVSLYTQKTHRVHTKQYMLRNIALKQALTRPIPQHPLYFLLLQGTSRGQPLLGTLALLNSELVCLFVVVYRSVYSLMWLSCSDLFNETFPELVALTL